MADDLTYVNSPAPEWLNETLVQTALREEDPRIIIESCDVDLDLSMRMFASDIYRVTATLDNGEERHVIVKCVAQAGLGSQLTELFDKEIKMLTETLPAMETLIQKVCPNDFQPFGPKCYYHAREPLPYVVLEDVRFDDFCFPSRKYGLDFDHCLMALKTLARFHAASIALHQQNPETMTGYCKHNFLGKYRDVVEEFCVRGVNCLAEEVQRWPGYEEFSEKLLKVKDTMCDRLVETMRRKEGSLNALIHADAWAGNLLFRYSSNEVTAVKLCDFQSVVFSSPIIDLMHYLYACSNIHVQLYRTDELTRGYYTTLSETLFLLGYSCLLPSLDEFLELCTQYNFYAFYISTTVLPLIIYDPLEAEDCEEIVKNVDIGPLKDTHPYKGKLYKCIMQYLLLFYEERGIL